MKLLDQLGEFDGLIFDCDGTLVDTTPLHYLAIETALKQQGMQMERNWYFDRVGLSPDALLREFEALAESKVNRSAFQAQYGLAYSEGIDALREVTVVADVARAWKGKVPMAVASNGQRTIVRGTLKNVGLLDLFDDVVTIEDVAQGKPAPDIYIEAARRIKVAPARCLVLEDSDEGLESARSAGIRAIDIRLSWTPDWKRS